MPRRPLQFKQMKDERKLSILEASLPLFAINSKEKVSIDSICKNAKCSHGLIYHYFKNVDEIYSELLKSLTYKSLKEALFVNFKSMYAFDGLKHITNTLITNFNEIHNICFISLIINEEGKDSLHETLIYLIKRGQKEGDVTGGDPKDIANAFLFIFKGMSLQYLLNKNSKVIIKDPDVVVELFRKRSRV